MWEYQRDYESQAIIDSGAGSRQCFRMNSRPLATQITRWILGTLQVVGAITCIFLEFAFQRGVLPRLLPPVCLLGCGYGLAEFIRREPSIFAVTLGCLCAILPIGIFGYLLATFTHG